MVICLERGADLHMAQLMPLPLTVSCFGKIQIGFTFLVLTHPGSPGKGPLKGCCCWFGNSRQGFCSSECFVYRIGSMTLDTGWSQVRSSDPVPYLTATLRSDCRSLDHKKRDPVYKMSYNLSQDYHKTNLLGSLALTIQTIQCYKDLMCVVKLHPQPSDCCTQLPAHYITIWHTNTILLHL